MAKTPEFFTHKEIQPFSVKERVRLGKEIVVVYGVWGTEFDNEQLMKLVKDRPEEEQSLINAMIKGTGITKRHHTWPPRSRKEHSSLINEEQVAVGARVTREALAANGWDKVDLLIVTASAPLSDDFAKQIADRAGLADVETRLYCLACDGAIAALHDILRTDELKETRVVITAVEGLSSGVNFNPGEVDITCATIFSNGASSLAFSPKNIELLAGKTVIAPDNYGVIRMPRTYSLPGPEERLEPPPWYKLEPGAEEKFAFTPNRVMMEIPEADSDYAQMDGFRTAKFFARVVPPVVRSLLEEYYQDGLSRLKTMLGVFHQPSAGVLGLANKRIEKMLKRANLPELSIPWILDKIGMGNVSSATTPLTLAQLKKEGRIPKEEPFNITGFGVGASVTSMVVRMNES